MSHPRSRTIKAEQDDEILLGMTVELAPRALYPKELITEHEPVVEVGVLLHKMLAEEYRIFSVRLRAHRQQGTET